MKILEKLCIATCAALLLVAADAHAQQAGKPIRIVVPYSAGGPTDIMARNLAVGMESILGQPVLIENITGATGSIALQRVRQAAPDGHTLVQVNGAFTANAAARPAANIDLNRDFEALGQIAISNFTLTVSPASGINSLADLIAAAKKKPGALTYGSIGPGSNSHLLSEILAGHAGIELTHVPYRGEAPAIPDLMAGRLDILFLTGAAPHVESKKIVALGITSPEPWFNLPGVKPLNQVGMDGFSYTSWAGLMAPKGTPPDVIARINAAMVTALNTERVRKAYEAIGLRAHSGTPQELTARIDRDMKLFHGIIRERNLKID